MVIPSNGICLRQPSILNDNILVKDDGWFVDIPSKYFSKALIRFKNVFLRAFYPKV